MFPMRPPEGPSIPLSERLERLREGLAVLGRRLRDGVAQVMGSAAGDAVRDALRKLLAARGMAAHASADPDFDAEARPAQRWGLGLDPEPPYRPVAPYQSSTPRPPWHEANDARDPWRDELPEEESYSRHSCEEEEEKPSEAKSSGRWTQALALGCQAAAWWLRRGAGRFALLGAASVGVMATLVAYTGGGLAMLGASLAELAGPALALAGLSPS
jgi:hypothetical protein